MRIPVLFLAGLCLAVALALRPGAFDIAATDPRIGAAMPLAGTAQERGAVAFAFHDWGGLTTAGLENATLPEPLAVAALALHATGGASDKVEQIDTAALLRGYGILTPREIGNWPDSLPQPDPALPLGRAIGQASGTWPPLSITLGNGTCALCHAGVTYDEGGIPQPDVAWLGTGNSSLDLGRFTNDLFAGFDGASDADLMAALTALYPELGLRERLTLRHAILPRLRAELAARKEVAGHALPFVAGRIGATNGVDAFRHQLGLLPPEGAGPGSFTSLPDLGDRLLRTRFLTPGVYARPGRQGTLAAADINDPAREDLAALITLFAVPAFGVSMDDIDAERAVARDVVAFLEGYRPQPFPGRIDPALARRGARIYAAECSACHGTYRLKGQTARLTTFPNWRGDVGTDPTLAGSVPPDLARAINSGFTGRIRAERPAGYAAPPLTGLWATAPYLHNGSVPSLWHLLTPAARPQSFDQGGHAIDFERLGLAYPAGFTPWAQPSRVETGEPGLGNGGHEFGSSLGEGDKQALLEFLKTL